MVRIFHIKIMLLFILLLSISGEAQSNASDRHDVPKSFILNANEAILEESLLTLLTETREFFIKNSGQIPNVMVVGFTVKDTTNIWITNRAYLYTDDEERKLLNQNFVAATRIYNTTVLFENKPRKHNNFFRIRRKKQKFEIIYGNYIHSCDHIFKIENQKFVKEKIFCGLENFYP